MAHDLALAPRQARHPRLDADALGGDGAGSSVGLAGSIETLD
jgi:hypothetical protein